MTEFYCDFLNATQEALRGKLIPENISVQIVTSVVRFNNLSLVWYPITAILFCDNWLNKYDLTHTLH